MFSKASGEEEDGAGGSSNGRWGMSSRTTFWKNEASHRGCMRFSIIYMLLWLFSMGRDMKLVKVAKMNLIILSYDNRLNKYFSVIFILS